MANVNTPNKTPGSTYTAAELNTRTNWINSPGKSLGAFNPAMVFDSQGQYNNYTLTSDIVLTASSIALFNMRVVRITANGTNNINFGAGIDKLITPFTNPLPAGDYWFYMASFIGPDGSTPGVHISIPDVQQVVAVVPQWQTASFEVGNVADNIVVLPLDVGLDLTSVPATTDFDIQVDASPNVVTNVSLATANQVRLTLTTPVTAGQTVTAAYTAGANPIRSAATQSNAANLTATAVTNNVSSFLPSDLSGLTIWLRKQIGVTEAGTGVSQWADQSGNGFDFIQGTDANRPSYNSGTGELTFNGTSDFLQHTGAGVAAMNADNIGWSLFVGKKQSGNVSGLCLADSAVEDVYLQPNICYETGDERDDRVAISINNLAANAVIYGNTTAIGPDTNFYSLVISNGSSYTIYTNSIEQTKVAFAGSDDGRWGNDLLNPDAIEISRLGRATPFYYPSIVKEIAYGDDNLTPQNITDLLAYAATL